VRRGLLYLGTENAIYVSFDDGDAWQPLQNDLPHAPVSGIVVQQHFNDLVISTYGRGFWILDDLAPLQQLTPDVMASPAHLFEPRAAYRFRAITPPSVPYDDPTHGEDPQYGASLSYWLKAPAREAPKLTIADAGGNTVRTLTGTNRAGVNRVYWDLEDEQSTQLRLLTSPWYAAHIQPGPEGRTAAGVSRMSILMPPGRYTVKLTVDGFEQTRPLTVLKDPHSAGTEAEVADQVVMLKSLKADLERGVAAVRRIEEVRVQLATLARFSQDSEVKQAAGALGEKLVPLEMNLVDLRLTGRGQDAIRFEAKLLQKIGYLASGLAGGDFRPTDQQLEVRKILATQLDEQLKAVDSLLATELPALNQLLQRKGATIIADVAK
jgi:hypothetical protein